MPSGPLDLDVVQREPLRNASECKERNLIRLRLWTSQKQPGRGQCSKGSKNRIRRHRGQSGTEYCPVF